MVDLGFVAVSRSSTRWTGIELGAQPVRPRSISFAFGPAESVMCRG